MSVTEAEREEKIEATALYDFEGEDDDELTFEEGTVFEVLKISGEWGLGRIGEKMGNFPLSFVKLDTFHMCPSISPGTPPIVAPPTPADQETLHRERERISETFVKAKRAAKVDVELDRKKTSSDAKGGEYIQAVKTATDDHTLALPADVPSTSSVRRRARVLSQVYMGMTTDKKHDRSFGSQQQNLLRELFKSRGAAAFFVHFGVRKLRYGRLQARVLEFNFLLNELHNLKDGKSVRSFKFSDIASIETTRTNAVTSRKNAAVVSIYWRGRKESTAYTVLMECEEDRKSLLELVNGIITSNVTTSVLQRRMRKLCLMEGALDVRPLTPKEEEALEAVRARSLCGDSDDDSENDVAGDTDGGVGGKPKKRKSKRGSLFSAVASMSSRSLLGTGDSFKWRLGIRAVLYEGAIFCYPDTKKKDKKKKKNSAKETTATATPQDVKPYFVVPVSARSVRTQVRQIDPTTIAIGRFFFRTPNEITTRQWFKAMSASAMMTSESMISERLALILPGSLGRKELETQLNDMFEGTAGESLGKRMIDQQPSTLKDVTGVSPLTLALMARFGQRMPHLSSFVDSSIFPLICGEILSEMREVLRPSSVLSSVFDTMLGHVVMSRDKLRRRRRCSSDISISSLSPGATRFKRPGRTSIDEGSHFPLRIGLPDELEPPTTKEIDMDEGEEDARKHPYEALQLYLDICIISINIVFGDVMARRATATLKTKSKPIDATFRVKEAMYTHPLSLDALTDALLMTASSAKPSLAALQI